jgi:hypothetical protein
MLARAGHRYRPALRHGEEGTRSSPSASTNDSGSLTQPNVKSAASQSDSPQSRSSYRMKVWRATRSRTSAARRDSRCRSPGGSSRSRALTKGGPSPAAAYANRTPSAAPHRVEQLFLGDEPVVIADQMDRDVEHLRFDLDHVATTTSVSASRRPPWPHASARRTVRAVRSLRLPRRWPLRGPRRRTGPRRRDRTAQRLHPR